LRDSPSCLFLPLNPSLIASFMMLIVQKQKKRSGKKVNLRLIYPPRV
jgi:hypothetical protein